MRKDQLLPAFINRYRLKPFAWGEWDCCQLFAEWNLEVTGNDVRDQFPDYANEAEAKEILDEAGGLVALVDSLFTPIHKSRAMRGDLVLANEESGGAVGICLGVHSAHVGPDGLLFFPVASAIRAWRVE